MVAAECLLAAFRGEDSESADVGALLIADYLALIRQFLTKK